MSEYKPELGQMCFGSPPGRYAIPEYACACFEYLLAEIRRVFGNARQRVWDEYEDPEIPGIEWRPYYWSDCVCPEDGPHRPDCPACLPNFKAFGAEIRWYKYPGRGMSCDVDWDERRWRVWFDACLAQIRAGEDKEIKDGKV